MAEKKDTSDNKEFDLDDIDELPDVVLGEKTRAMRTIHEDGAAVLKTGADKQNTESHSANVQSSVQKNTSSETTSSVQNETENTLTRIDRQFANVQNDKSHSEMEEKQDSTEEKPSLKGKSDVSFPDTPGSDHSSDKTETVSVQPDNEENKQVKEGAEKKEDKSLVYHNDNEDDDEIPTSVIDDIPGVENDLDHVLNPKKTTHDITDPLPPVSDELSKVYHDPDNASVTGKHVAHHQKDEQATFSTNTVEATAATEENTPQDHQETAKTDSVKEDQNNTKKKKKKRKTNILQRIVIIILIILLVLLAIGVYEIYSSLQPVSNESEPVSFQVNEGETISDVSQSLAKEGIIKDARTGYYYARFNHLTDVKKGVFKLDKSWSLKQLYTYLNDDLAADQDAVMVTLTEGDWAKDMADKIAKSTNVKADDLMALWNNDDYIRKNLMSKYPFLTDDIFNENVKVDLEGYLAPDTYTFNKETSAEEVTTKILDQTNKIYAKYADQIKNSGYTTNQIYTLASIVQGESSREDQMKKIAGVFYNRLKQNMPLQSSVTTCYIIDFDKGKTDWQECEASYNTEKQDPYNTYQNQGLPPGPVQNPGDAALNAVLNPDQNDYLFFMADVCGNTGIHYAKTEEEHEANVAKYNTCN